MDILRNSDFWWSWTAVTIVSKGYSDWHWESHTNSRRNYSVAYVCKAALWVMFCKDSNLMVVMFSGHFPFTALWNDSCVHPLLSLPTATAHIDVHTLQPSPWQNLLTNACLCLLMLSKHSGLLSPCRSVSIDFGPFGCPTTFIFS